MDIIDLIALVAGIAFAYVIMGESEFLDGHNRRIADRYVMRILMSFWA